MKVDTEEFGHVAFGTLDFALDLERSGGAIGLDAASSQLALASFAAGSPSPVADVTPDFQEPAALRIEFARARAHGFNAKLCIHPRQIEWVHDALRPSADELDWARHVVAAAKGSAGAAQVDGRMVDRPVLQPALRLLAQAR